MAIKTAAEHHKAITLAQRREQRRKRAEKNKPKISIEDLRDETMSIVRNSGKTYEEIHAKWGASPSTLTKWQYREVLRPQLNLIRGTLLACGYDLVIARKDDNVVKLTPGRKK